jgi:glycogen debranching enzyme
MEHRRITTRALPLCAAVAAICMLTGAGHRPYVERHGGGAVRSANDGGLSTPKGAELRERWEIRVPALASREFIYTNHVATHFSAEAVGANSRSYHGLYCSMHEYVDSWELSLDGSRLDPADISEALVYPYTIHRIYSKTRATEEIFLPDTLNALAVRFTADPGGAGAGELVPWLDMRFIWEVPKPEYRVIWSEKTNVLLVSRADEPAPEGRPAWIAITASVPMHFIPAERYRPTDYPKDAARRAMARTNPFSPGRLAFSLKGRDGNAVTFVFGLGADERGASAEARKLLAGFARCKREKLRLIEERLRTADVVTGKADFNKAYRWARVSMDNLIMNQRGMGIYAGFFWFPNYWGRDSFISLPGACLATGRYDAAREILASFMTYQEADAASPRLGRFPNIVNPDNLQYGGVDGTWWLLRAAWKYYMATGDGDFLRTAFPHVRLAIEGALKKAVDAEGFLTHGDGETWMDAGGNEHPYSPRGNRAVEVEALFHHGLLVGSAWARTLAAASASDAPSLDSLAAGWEGAAVRLAESFHERFWNARRNYLYDHLNGDGTPDERIRPNAVLALWVSLDAGDFASLGGGAVSERPAAWKSLIETERAREIVATALATIVLPYGVASLDPSDTSFHPYHLAFDRYFFDEAYHNGDVWEWLTGPMVSCLLDAGMTEHAWKLCEPLVDEILNRGCVGTLREIRDGVYTEGKDEFGGATSQAWSLAEFIRVCQSEFVSLADESAYGGISSARAPEARRERPAGCRYIGIHGWIAGNPVADPRRVPAEWMETRYRIPCVATLSGGRGHPFAVETVEGSVLPAK